MLGINLAIPSFKLRCTASESVNFVFPIPSPPGLLPVQLLLIINLAIMKTQKTNIWYHIFILRATCVDQVGWLLLYCISDQANSLKGHIIW